jgi:uncharacterized protein GlcG (DUF336 family)
MHEQNQFDGPRLVRELRSVSLAGARIAIDHACRQAVELDIAISVAVVDTAGELISFARMDGALGVSGPLAIDKAWTSAACGSPTEEWTDVTQPGGEEWGFNTALGGRLVVQPGGVPLEDGAGIVGAVAVSGGSLAQDTSCAKAAAEGLRESFERQSETARKKGVSDV